MLCAFEDEIIKWALACWFLHFCLWLNLYSDRRLFPIAMRYYYLISINIIYYIIIYYYYLSVTQTITSNIIITFRLHKKKKRDLYNFWVISRLLEFYRASSSYGQPPYSPYEKLTHALQEQLLLQSTSIDHLTHSLLELSKQNIALVHVNILLIINYWLCLFNYYYSKFTLWWWYQFSLFSHYLLQKTANN